VRLGIVGRGYWGDTYARVLKRLHIPHWQDGRYWHIREAPDGLIVACKSEAHYEVAKCALGRGIPVLVEKPVCMSSAHAQELVDLGGIAFAGHTRLYDPNWLKGPASSVDAWCGGVTESNPDPYWNWLPHLAAMCFDLGFDPDKATFHISKERQPLRFVADGREFIDSDEALPCLIRAFVQAIEAGKPDNSGLVLGLKTIQFVERYEPRRLHSPGR
jgi:hypothetical protein